MIPESLFHLMDSCKNEDTRRFPATHIFNEGWLLRLILDAFQTLGIENHPLQFLEGANWFSESRLSTPFEHSNKHKLGENATRADGVIGHFSFRKSTKAGLELKSDASQFIVIEAKMFSPISPGVKNEPGYHQVARNLACMAQTIYKSECDIKDFDSLGFFVLAPEQVRTKLEACFSQEPRPEKNYFPIRDIIHRRIAKYESHERPEVEQLHPWELKAFLPLMDHLEQTKMIGFLAWEDCIEAIKLANPTKGNELQLFYKQSRDHNSRPKTISGRT